MSRDRRRGGALAAVMLTIVMVGALSIAALVATGFYIADNVRVTERDSHDEATIDTPFGSVHVRKRVRLDPDLLGLPIYPGAVRDHDSHNRASFDLDIGDRHKSFAVAAADYRTRDSVDEVTDFYRQHLPHWLISQRINGGLQLSLTKGGYKRMVAIFEDDGETHIALASMGEPASN
ncbi:MAG TPA: hypothetical protein VMT86_21065 [Bryobacteraceae bacterium]|nr:hypothetical protein [Bryobacteraceae bacterium]